MKVTPTGNPSTQAAIQANETTNTSRAEKNAQSHKTKKEIPEGVSSKISSRAREFIKAKELASQAPDIREQRVAELKKKIAEGKYQVDSDAVADRLVEEHLQTSRSANADLQTNRSANADLQTNRSANADLQTKDLG